MDGRNRCVLGMFAAVVGIGLPAWQSTREGGERRRKVPLAKTTSLRSFLQAVQNTGNTPLFHTPFKSKGLPMHIDIPCLSLLYGVSVYMSNNACLSAVVS